MAEVKEKTEIEKLQDKIKQQDATIEALKNMLKQMTPMVDVVLPLLKERPEIDKKLIAQVEKIIQLSKMMVDMSI